MKCRSARRLIQGGAKDRLPRRLAAGLDAHLSSCPDCSSFSVSAEDEEQRLYTMLNIAAAEMSVDDGFAFSVVTALASHRVPATPIRRRLDALHAFGFAFANSRRAMATAGCAMLAAAAILLGSVLADFQDSAPTAAPRITCGRLMTFTIQPTHGGGALAGMTSHRYCQITRDRTEALR